MKKLMKVLTLFVAMTFIVCCMTMISPFRAFADGTTTVDADGTVHGAQIGTDQDGKPIYSQPPLSAAMQDKLKKKDAMAKAHALYKNNSITKDEYIKRLQALGADAETINKAKDTVAYPTETSNTSGISTMSAAYTSNNILDLLQQPQQRTYWCGPATASEIVEAYLDSSTYSQSYMASVLGTTTDGTPWYTNRYPMADALNSVENTSWYMPYGTTVVAATFQDYVTFDIDVNRGVAANAWEVAGSSHPHLTGHPIDKTIYHWIAIDRYDESGYLIHYADSVHNSSVSWAASVPAYSEIDYVTMARIMNGRGIIW